MTVAVSGDSITFPDNSVQATAPKVGMVNRIINGAMVISQRNAGASVTIGTGATSFVADRFFCLSSGGQTFAICDTSLPTGSGFQYAVKLQPQTGATSVQLNQRIEAFNSMDLAGQNITLSFWVYTSGLSGTSSYVQPYTATSVNNFGSSTFGASQPISYTNGSWVKNTFTFSASNNSMNAANGLGIIFNFRSAVGSTIYITGVQLEKGSTATSFDYRPYGTELGLCQRYYTVLTPAYSGLGFTSGVTTSSWIMYSLPTSMRTTPTANYITAYISDMNTYGVSATSIASQDGTNSTCAISYLHPATGGSAYRPAISNGATTFSSEL